jgi:O-antigen ligase
MITLFAISLLLLSLISTTILRNSTLSLLLLLVASNRSTETIIICALGVTLFLQCLFMDAFKKNKIFWFIVILFMAYYIAIFTFQPYKIRLGIFISYINALMMFLITLSINWNKEKLTKFAIAYISVFIIWGLLEFLFADPTPTRIAGPQDFATLYAVVLVTVWTIWLTQTIFNSGYSGKIIVVTAFVLLVVLLSGTKMGLIGIVLGLFLSGISKNLAMNSNKSIIVKMSYGIASLICLLVLTIVVWQLIPDDMFVKKTFKTLLSMKLDRSNLGRVVAWTTAIEIIPKHILWGIGPFNFDIHLNRIGLNLNYRSLGHAHNLFLIVLTEFGISGFIVIGSIVFSCVFKLFYFILKGTQNSVVYSIVNGFIVMMVLGMFDGTPLTLGTLCFGGWLMGISLYFSFFEKTEVSVC